MKYFVNTFNSRENQKDNKNFWEKSKWYCHDLTEHETLNQNFLNLFSGKALLVATVNRNTHQAHYMQHNGSVQL